MLTGNKVPQHKVNYATSVLKPTKAYFAWNIQQSVDANTTFSVTRYLYCNRQVSHCHSNLVTTPSSYILLTLASACNQNLTCSTPSSLSSFSRISFILGKLKVQLTKSPLYHAAKNGSIPGKRTHVMLVNGEHSSRRISITTIQRGTSSHITYGNVLNTHVHLMTTNTWTPLMDPASQESTRVTSKQVQTQPHGS